MKQFLTISFYLSLILLLPAGSLRAETRYETVQLRLGWQDVEGNRGYAIEVEERAGASVLSSRVPRNEAKLDLKPGEYRIRIAALNKFGKPSVWTDWNDIVVTGKERVQEFTAQKEQPKKPAPARPFSYDSLVPGMPRLKRHDALGYAWIALFSGITIYGLSANVDGTTIAHKPLNDPLYLAGLSYATHASFPVMLLSYQHREEDHTRYNTLQEQQRVAAGAFVLLYGLHYLDAIRLSARPAKSVEAFVGPSLDRAALLTGGAGERPAFSPGALSAIRFGITMRY